MYLINIPETNSFNIIKTCSSTVLKKTSLTPTKDGRFVFTTSSSTSNSLGDINIQYDILSAGSVYSVSLTVYDIYLYRFVKTNSSSEVMELIKNNIAINKTTSPRNEHVYEVYYEDGVSLHPLMKFVSSPSKYDGTEYTNPNQGLDDYSSYLDQYNSSFLPLYDDFVSSYIDNLDLEYIIISKNI